jgi:hypothetical protein
VLPPLPTRAALVLAVFVAAIAASARADTPPPLIFDAHGVTFTYPSDWVELPVTYDVQTGTPLWIDSLGPIPPLTPPSGSPPAPGSQPTAPSTNLVTLAGYHVGLALTKKNIGRYKQYFAASVAQLAAAAHGQVQSGPTRVTLAGLPGYAFQITVQRPDGSMLQNRLVFAFRRKTEYFVNCQHPPNDPLAAEIDSGCTQIMQSFRLSK